ncbi:hypothetical protein TrST_g4691 [Triparma strigata]|uniref:Mur ligase central domain-containing protein n=1 Tax=Triparma strigata TaxID=1606541 RepID=A0A9W7E8F4_9STRA|nr:hypothetical protein TrST_g4691 [Triparma strigata]
MSSPTSYERLVRRLYRTNLYNPVKLGLNNIQDLAVALNSPFYSPPSTANSTVTSTSPPSSPSPPSSVGIIHIAGTNGKGSVSYKIAESLRLSGFKTGLFVSPHISSFRERVQVDGVCIEEEHVNVILSRIFKACENENIPATFFEITTAMALEFFDNQKVDAIVLETGLGGRLDSTNLVQSDLAVVTSIGLEHTRILGDTKEEIGREKAGIFKMGRPALVGVDVPFSTMKSEAERHGVTTLHTIGSVLGPEVEETFMSKDFDEQNSYVAKSALQILSTTDAFQKMSLKGLKISPSAVAEGCKKRPPCRFELTTCTSLTNKSVPVILDVAHNPPALLHLFSKLSTSHPSSKKRIVIGMSSDKDLSECGKILLSNVSPTSVHLVEASHPRAAKIPDILEACPGLSPARYDLDEPCVEKQTLLAIEEAAENDEVLIVCGSVFLMAGARKALGYNEPRDSDFVAKEAGANLRKDLQEHFGNRVWSEDEESEGDADEREFEEFLEGAKR